METMSHRIAAAGAGRMGRSLAVVFALAGHPVALVDLKKRDDADSYLTGARTEIRSTLEMLVSCGMIDAEIRYFFPRAAVRIDT